MAGLNKEVWLSLIKEQFYPDFTFLNEALDLSAFVQNDVINLAEAGVSPNVLKNNTTYPVPASTRADVGITLTLAYYDTESTIVRNAEQAELSYDKMSSILYGHKQALLQRQYNEAAHAYAPGTNGTHTPVVSTTGALSGGHRLLSYADIARMAQRFDAMRLTQAGRVLVLDSTAMEQLRNEDRVLFNQMMNHADGGAPGALYGFRVYSYEQLPLYNSAGSKKAFGDVFTAGDRFTRAIAFQREEVMKAVGSLDMFERLRDPDARGDIIGFQQRFLALPIRNKGIGSIITATA
ncbi:MAG: hypothetical protein LW884_07020 [Bacteroidetes bacterium]|jgi:hypothetical protein|nr:hypothetical protein [Bacteroidota bacterium]